MDLQLNVGARIQKDFMSITKRQKETEKTIYKEKWVVGDFLYTLHSFDRDNGCHNNLSLT